MIVFTLQLPPDRVPFINPSDLEACNELAAALAEHFANSIPAQPEVRKIARDFATGRHVVFVTMHTEPALLFGPSRS